ncbi:MAG: DNA alkylation repair protein [Fuerstiella sp.]
MDLASVMSELQSSGTKTTARVASAARLQKIRDKVGSDQDLAVQLWETGSDDARSLAMLIADPEELTPSVATQWMKDVDDNVRAAEVAQVVAQSPVGPAKMRQWRKQKSEFARATGYEILISMLIDDPDAVEELECKRVLKDIQMEIHRSPVQAQSVMAQAVVSIGVYKEELSEEALEAAEEIEAVESFNIKIEGRKSTMCDALSAAAAS